MTRAWLVLVGVVVALLAVDTGCKKNDEPAPEATKPVTKPAPVTVPDAAPVVEEHHPSAITAKIDLPKVAAGMAVAPPPAEAVMVTITKTEILVEGDSIVAVADDTVAPAEKVQGQFGIEIVKLRQVLELHAKRIRTLAAHQDVADAAPGEGLLLTLVADRTVTNALVNSALYTAGQAGFTTFAVIVVKADGALAATQLQRPTYETPAGAKKPALQMIIAVTPGQLMLFSVGGNEGKIDKPLLTIDAKTPKGYDFDVAPLAKAAAGLVQRHPDPADRELVILPGPLVPLQTIVDVTVAVRAAADGTPLFQDVQLATGIR